MPRKTPTEEAVLDYLRMVYEDDPNMAWKDTDEIAEWFGCHIKSLYNADKDKGVLYELWQDGTVIRREGNRTGEWQWSACGARIEWD